MDTRHHELSSHCSPDGEGRPCALGEDAAISLLIGVTNMRNEIARTSTTHLRLERPRRGGDAVLGRGDPGAHVAGDALQRPASAAVLPTYSRWGRAFPVRLSRLMPYRSGGAEGGTRTPTGCPTRPSNVRVCQFRHFGASEQKVCRWALPLSIRLGRPSTGAGPTAPVPGESIAPARGSRGASDR